MVSKIDFHAQDADWTCASWQQLFCLVWRGESNAQRARVALAAFETFLTRRTGLVGGIVVVEPTAPPPEAEVRPIFVQMMRKGDKRVCGVAYMVPGTGFKSAMVRGAITGLSLLARESYPMQVLTTVDDTLRWMGGRLYGDAIPSGFFLDAEMVMNSLREVPSRSAF